MCNAIEDLTSVEGSAAALDKDIAAHKWTRASLDVDSLGLFANSASDELRLVRNWQQLPAADSVAFLVDYAEAYSNEATDIGFDLAVGDYLSLEYRLDPPLPMGTLRGSKDRLEAAFGPCL